MEVPIEEVTLLRGARETFVPHSNSGFVAFADRPQPSGGKQFVEHWLDTALAFGRNCSIANTRPWLDQITLPLTMKRFGYRTRDMDGLHNYSLSHRLDYAKTPGAVILHFHRMKFLFQAPQWPDLRDLLIDTVPAKYCDKIMAHVRAIETSLEAVED